jgi:hypothetical protein
VAGTGILHHQSNNNTHLYEKVIALLLVVAELTAIYLISM